MTSSQPSAVADPAWRAKAAALRQLYLGACQDVTAPEVSPLFQQELQGVAAAYVRTASLDPLRDDGRLYAQRLESAGIRVLHEEFPATHVAASQPVQTRMETALVRALEELL
jgi:acetyl esterase/lipase